MESVHIVGIVNFIGMFVMYFFLTCRTDRIEEKIDRLLKAQTEPQKPKDLRFIHPDEIGGNCPSCDRTVRFAQKHCHNCTQLLDWTEVATWSADVTENIKPLKYAPDENGWREGAYLKEDK